MSEDGDHLATLEKAREIAVHRRRQLSSELSKEGYSGEKEIQFIAVQDLIEAIDQAVADEHKHGKPLKITKQMVDDVRRLPPRRKP
jgi:hypothetical protein